MLDRRPRALAYGVERWSLENRGGEPVYLGPGDDRYDGENKRGPGEVVYGEAGDDAINGFRGDDRLYGGAGDDALFGGNGHDRLVGGGGDDRIGSTGNDVLIGGRGADQIEPGSGGSNRIVYKDTSDSLPGDHHDTIIAFKTHDDRIDLSRIDADVTTPENDSFSWIGAGAFGGVAGELRYDPSTGLLQGDTNGDGVADFEVSFRFGDDVHPADVLL